MSQGGNPGTANTFPLWRWWETIMHLKMVVNVSNSLVHPPGVKLEQKKLEWNGGFLRYVVLQKHSVQWVRIHEQWNNCKSIQGCWFDLITGISNRHKAEERWSSTGREPLAKNGLICNAAVRGPRKFSCYSVTVCSKNTNIKQNEGAFIRSWGKLLFGSVVVGMKTSICRNVLCSSTCVLDLSSVKLLLLTQNIRQLLWKLYWLSDLVNDSKLHNTCFLLTGSSLPSDIKKKKMKERKKISS